jgi:hypothetical protein
VSPAFLRDLERLQPEVFLRIQAVRREILPQVWSKLLTAGIRKGHVRADLEVPFFCEVVLLAVEGLMRPAAMDRFGLSPSQICTRLLSLLFAGVLTPAGRKAYEL